MLWIVKSLKIEITNKMLMSITNLDLDSLAHLHWLEAAILLGHRVTYLKGFRLRNVLWRCNESGGVAAFPANMDRF